MTQDLSGPADTRIMGIVHSALRRDLARTRAELTTTPYPDGEQRVAIADHLRWMMTFLHRHHESEDAFLYPLVRSRDDSAAVLLDEMDQDHQSILPAMDGLEAAAANYRESGDGREPVLAAVDTLEDVLLPHLDREENEMMPIASANVTKAEWKQWDDDYNVKPLKPLELADTGLWIMDGLQPDDLAVVTALVPPVPRWVIVNVLSRRYRRQAGRRWRARAATRV
jgi:hypothetical protein